MVGTSTSGNRDPKDYGLLLFLPPEGVLALAKLQYELGLGRSYAGLLALHKGFHDFGAINDEQWAMLEERYSKKLEIKIPEKKPEVLPPKVVAAKAAEEKLDRVFKAQMGELEARKDDIDWRFKIRQYAEKHKDLQSARDLIAKIDAKVEEAI